MYIYCETLWKTVSATWPFHHLKAEVSMYFSLVLFSLRCSLFGAPGNAVRTPPWFPDLSLLGEGPSLGSWGSTSGGQQIRLVSWPCPAYSWRRMAPSGPRDTQDSARSDNPRSSEWGRRNQLREPGLRSEVPSSTQPDWERLELCNG